MRHMARPMMFGGGADINYVGSGGGIPAGNGAQPIPYPTGTVAGDLAFVVFYNSGYGNTLSTAGWSSIMTTGSGAAILWKVLTTADLTATATVIVSLSSATLEAFVFRGVAAASNLSIQSVSSNDTTTSRSWTGVTKGAACRALVFLMGLSTGSGTMSISSPAMASLAYGPTGGNLAGGARKFRTAYVFTPSQYTNTTAIAESYGSGWDQLDFAVFELT